MRIALATVAVLVVLVAATPSAAAGGSTSTKPERPTVVVKVARGFYWTDALIGAAAASGALLAIAGALRALRHEGEEKR